MTGLVEGRFLEGVVSGREGAGCAFSVHPLRDSIDDFFAGDVVADEVNEASLASGKDFLEGFEHELVDEEVVHGGEVCAEGHVIEIRVSLGSSEGRVNELLIAGRIRDALLIEVCFERFELSLGEVVSKST